MNVDQVRTYCLAFPEATEKLQWGDALCFKVSTKMFAVLGLDRVRLTFKCTSEKFAELIERQDVRRLRTSGATIGSCSIAWTRCRTTS